MKFKQVLYYKFRQFMIYLLFLTVVLTSIFSYSFSGHVLVEFKSVCKRQCNKIKITSELYSAS